MRKQYMFKQYMDNPSTRYFTSKYMSTDKDEIKKDDKKETKINNDKKE